MLFIYIILEYIVVISLKIVKIYSKNLEEI